MMRLKRFRPVAITQTAVAAICLIAFGSAAAQVITMASTTSTEQSGLFSHLLPAFKQATGIDVKVVAVGTGQALDMARRGDADVLFVHDQAAEEKFVADGWGVKRYPVMYNDFVLVGPPSDPAAIRGLGAAEAMRKIATKLALFASRDDRSGTHARELELWKRAAVDPAGRRWYVATGQGMGETMRIASEMRAYTLADRGTFLALKKSLDLAVLVEGTPDLRNSYRVIVVSPEKNPKTRVAEARRFAEWIVSDEAQKAIAAFGKEKFGEALFVPDAKKG